jgi:hypothetical protein
VERDFDEIVRGYGCDAGSAGEQPSEQLHIERPTRRERFGQRGNEGRRVAENFGAALGVVVRRADRKRRDGREDAAGVVARGLALDVAAGKTNARGRHRRGAGAVELVHETQHFVDGRRQIGVEKAGRSGAGLAGREHGRPHGFGLAGVARVGSRRDAPRRAFRDAPGHAQGVVAGPVVDQPDVDVLGQAQELAGIEPLRFVVAGDDDDRASGGSLGPFGRGRHYRESYATDGR